MVHVSEAKQYQGVSLSTVEFPNMLELLVLSPPLMVANSQTTIIQRVIWVVYFAGSKCLIIILTTIINALKCSMTIPFCLRQQRN